MTIKLPVYNFWFPSLIDISLDINLQYTKYSHNLSNKSENSNY